MLIQLILAAILNATPTQSTNPYEGWVVATVEIECPEDIESLRNMGARSLACFDHAGQTPMLMTQSMIEEAALLRISAKIIERDIKGSIEAMDRRRSEARRSELVAGTVISNLGPK